MPGDVVHLSAGDMIPADVRLIAAKDLFVNQAPLTGEALPVEKHAAAERTPMHAIGDLNNICFMGTTVVSGSATGVIALTGRNAYFGGLAEAIAGERPLTSFDKGINRFAWLMIRFILVMAPLVFLINGLTKGDWLQALLFATAVAVGLTPEMLPMIVTVNLAKGAIAMSRRKVVVKRLNAIQNFGAMDVLCTDKTGTLTQDRVILQKALDLDGEDSEEVLEYAFLNSHYQSGLKNLLDLAVLHHSRAEALERAARGYRKLDEVPFDFERRRMSVAVEAGARRLLICKGAVEEVFAVSRRGRARGETFTLHATHLAHRLSGSTQGERGPRDRKVFGNVVKYIRMGASSNFGNMFSVIGASAWLPFLPMAPVQVLTNNLLYDLSQTAIPTDSVDEEYLARPRRWEIGNIGRYMVFIGPISSLFDYATYLTMYLLFGARTVAQASLFQTEWFVESIIWQTLIIHVIRTRRVAFIESRASAPLMATSLAVCALGAALPYSPFAHALGFVPLPPLYWPLLALMVLAYLGLTHVMKVWFHRRFGLG